MREEIQAVLDGGSPGASVTGNCYAVMPEMPDGCMDTACTSPPYFGLRDYGIPASDWPEVTFSPMPGLPPMVIPAESSVHGLEKNIWAYVAHEVLVFREVRRLLADHGVLFLNLGDSYANDGKWSGETGGKQAYLPDNDRRRVGREKHTTGLKPKDLCGIPWRVAYALQADGWYLRQDIIWAKKSPMPESVTDRCAKAHEYIFILTKSADYYWDQEGVKEEAAGVSGGACIGPQNKPGLRHIDNGHGAIGVAQVQSRKFDRTEYHYRNRRSVWVIGPEPCKDAHFATFPTKIPEICILAGCPREVCVVCGKPRERIVEKNRVATRGGNNSKVYVDPEGSPYQKHSGDIIGNRDPERHCTEIQTIGWTDCGHNSYRPGRVIDCFGGSGTVGYVAAKLKRDYVLIDMNPKYVEDIAAYKLQEAEVGVPAREAKKGQLALFGEKP